RFASLIRLTRPTCPGALSSRRTTASTPATTVASADLVEESSATRRALPLWRASLAVRQMKAFLWSLRKCRASALGSMAHSLNGAPTKSGRFNKRRHDHVPEQNNPHRLSRQQPRSSHQQPGIQRHHSFAGNEVFL